MSLSIVVITLNEERNIAACLDTVRWADEMVIIDGRSSDKTLSIARSFTDKIFRIPFKDFSSQKNEGIRKATGDWILILDADERVTPRLRSEIQEIVNRNDPDTAYAIKRMTFFFGHRLSFSGTENDYPVRLFPRGKACFTQPVHEEIVTKLPVAHLNQALIHYSTQDRVHYQQKLDQYVPMEVEVLRSKGKKPRMWDFWIRPPLKFLHLYIWKAGWRDGRAGFHYARLSAYYVFRKYRLYWQICHKKQAMLVRSL